MLRKNNRKAGWGFFLAEELAVGIAFRHRLDWHRLLSAQSWPGLLTNQTLLWLLLEWVPVTECSYWALHPRLEHSRCFCQLRLRTFWLDALRQRSCSPTADPGMRNAQIVAVSTEGLGLWDLGRKQWDKLSVLVKCLHRGILHAQLPTVPPASLCSTGWTSQPTDLDHTDSQGGRLASVEGETFGLRDLKTKQQQQKQRLLFSLEKNLKQWNLWRWFPAFA